MSNEEHKYLTTYSVEFHDGGITEGELAYLGDVGACDSLLLCSVVGKFGEGGISFAWFGRNGHEQRDINPSEMFKCWVILAAKLAEALPDGSRRNLCGLVHESIKKAILMQKIEGDPV